MRSYYTHTRKVILKILPISTTDGIGYWATRTPMYSLWECKLVQPPWKTILQYLHILSIRWHSSSCHSISPREMVVYIHQKTHKVIILAALLIIVWKWKHSNFKISCTTFIYKKQRKDWRMSILYNTMNYVCYIEWKK